MSLEERCWMITSKFSVIAILIITGICFGVFVYPYMKKKREAALVSIVYIGIMSVLYLIPQQIGNFSAYMLGGCGCISCDVCTGQKKHLSENISCSDIFFYPLACGCNGRQTG